MNGNSFIKKRNKDYIAVFVKKVYQSTKKGREKWKNDEMNMNQRLRNSTQNWTIIMISQSLLMNFSLSKTYYHR